MQALVEFNYEAHELDELTIRKGDIIRDIKVSHGGWWEGTLGNQRGMFPDNFVKVIEQPAGARNSAESKEEDVTLRNGPGRRYCKVLFSYEPCNDDELKLVPDEAIEYLGEVEEGWWRGRIKGRTGVFPSNFVTGPVPEEAERNKKELCRVLFPYEANNDDELTLTEGDVVTLVSKEAPDKGWWKGELRGQVGFFPDNFVELIVVKTEHTDGAANQVPTGKTLVKHQTGKKKETAVVRKSLDTRNVRTDGTAKKIPNSASSSLTGSLEKKPASNLISSLKRLVGESSSNANTNSNSNSASSATNNGNGTAGAGLGEELDEVERGEGAPLSHLTASRAKAPRRRLPSTQHLRHQGSSSAPDDTNDDSEKLPEDNMTNGNSEVTAVPEKTKDDENDGMVAKARKRAPWVEELKMNQMERRKMGTDQKSEKNETKKDRVYSWVTSSSNNSDIASKPEVDGEDFKPKEREREKPPRPEPPVSEQLPSPPVSSPPAYVPYHLYSQLLDRIAVLEEKQTVLQRKVNQLSERVAPLVSNAASDRD